MINHHKGELSTEVARHLKILKNKVSETAFLAFLHDFGAKMQDFHKYGFSTSVAGRWVSCGSHPHEACHLGSM